MIDGADVLRSFVGVTVLRAEVTGGLEKPRRLPIVLEGRKVFISISVEKPAASVTDWVSEVSGKLRDVVALFRTVVCSVKEYEDIAEVVDGKAWLECSVKEEKV